MPWTIFAKGAPGYFRWLARDDSSAFAGLVGKILPATIEWPEWRVSCSMAALDMIPFGFGATTLGGERSQWTQERAEPRCLNR
jgi:hypothetical protein